MQHDKVQASGHAFQVWYHFLLVVGAVQLCISSRVDHLSRPEGCDLNFEGLEPYHDSCMRLWMHRFSSTSSPLVPFLTRAPSLGQVWVLRVPRWVGSRLVGCVRRFRPAPPPLVCVWPVVRPLFLFPCPFRALWAVCVGVGVSPFSFPLLRPPSRVPVKKLSSHFHRHLISMALSSSPSFVGALKSPAAAGRACEPSEEM